MSSSAASIGASAPSFVARPGRSPDGATEATYRRREASAVGAGGDVMRALTFIVFPLLGGLAFLAVGLSSGGLGGVFFALFPLAIVLVFVAVGIPAFLESLGRMAVTKGDAEALIVSDSGITMTGMGHLRWSEIAAINIGAADIVEGEGGEPNRPRLEIVPRDPGRLAARPWAARSRDTFLGRIRRLKPWGDRTPKPGAFALDLDLLDADPEAVIDLIARHRVVEED